VNRPRGHVTLPFDDDDFKDFIKSLLGSPQSINKSFSGRFEVSIEDFGQLNDLIDQRITQQNKARLIQFTARIIFSDSSSVLLNTFDDFSTYNEVRPVFVTAVHLSWDYLVQFEDKKSPEKQKIQVSIVTKDLDNIYNFDSDVVIGHFRTHNYIDYNIQHTARTWGADLAALLSNWIENQIIKDNRTKLFLKKHNGNIGFVLFFSFLAVSVVTSLYSVNRHQISQENQIKKLFETPKSSDYMLKIDYILNYITSGDWPRFLFYSLLFFIITFLFTFIFAIWMSDLISTEDPGYILISKECSKHKEKTQQKLQSNWIKFFFAIVANILYGIISNFLFLKINQ
jgi:hypothetical protein